MAYALDRDEIKLVFNNTAELAPVPSWHHAGYMVMGISECLGGLLSVASNLFVLITILVIPKLINPTNIFIASMCLAQSAGSLLTAPLGISSNFSERWIWEQSGCIWYGFVSTFCGLITISNHTAIAIYRFQSIDAKHQGAFRNQHAIVWSLSGWVYALCWTLPPAIGWSNYGFEGPGTWCSVVWFDKQLATFVYSVCLMLFCFLLPLAVMIAMYCLIYMKIKDMQKDTVNDRVRQLGLKRQQKLLKMSVAINVAFILAWTPYAIVAIIQVLGYADTINFWVHGILTLIAKSSAFYTPILYTCMSSDYNMAVNKVICCLGKNVHDMKDETRQSNKDKKEHIELTKHLVSNKGGS